MYPRAAPPGSVRAWIGLPEYAGRPKIRWLLDGEEQPHAKTRLDALRPDELYTSTPDRRMWTGAVDFHVQTTSREHLVTAQLADGSARSIRVRSLPADVPEEGLHILLSSCFYRAEACAGELSATLEAIQQHCPPRPLGRRPDFSLLMGDQVYLDLPPLTHLPNEVGALAANFERKYLDNWGSSLRSLARLLGFAPSLALPDDHEYWNNYPAAAAQIGRTWNQRDRIHYADIAGQMYAGFQAPFPERSNKSVRIDVSPMSLLALDTRSHRTAHRLLSKQSHDDLLRWVSELERGQVGILVTGQSLFAHRKGKVAGGLGDWEPPNYVDFKRIVTTLTHAPCPLICVTGDVHWGRVLKAASREPHHRPDIFEVIVSPLSLVTTPIVDTWVSRARRFLALFSDRPKSERHPKPPLEAGVFANFLTPKPYAIDVMRDDNSGDPATVQGNQLALLSVYTHAGRPRVKVRYWLVDRDPSLLRTVTLL